MKKINFTKMVASGNDFVVAEIKDQKSKIKNLNAFAKNICNRKYGVGADGLLVLGKGKNADISMRIFNADGSHAQMCGNGARCAALYSARNTLSGTGQKPVTRGRIKIETKAGIIESEVKNDNVKIKLTDPKDIKLDVSIKVNNRAIKVNFINTGVPHTVIFVEGLDKIDVADIGREIRYHKEFKPSGANVNFVQILNDDSIEVRTYERGVEDETLACGTGSVASALLFAIRYPLSANKINVKTRSGEILKVSFEKNNNLFKNVCLEGKAKIVFKGEYNYV